MESPATHTKNHPYQIIDPSPWPLLASLGVLILGVGGALAMHGHTLGALVLGLLVVVVAAAAWWRDMIVESKSSDIYTNKVQIGLRIGMVLFICSELLFFVAFFWSFFNAALFPNEVMGNTWPPKGIVTLDPFHLPYLNTLLLLLSGTTVTWAHHALLENKQKDVFKALLITVALGMIFTAVQGYEYLHAPFAMKDGVYGSNFYLATGFHGVHVIIGTIFLAVCAARARTGDFSPKAHVGFEAAAWYWHFVDVVWLFLFVSIYWWGRGGMPVG
jgi:cytochrome c oxidase subunit 3